jgi:hypothetical protein
MASVGVLNQFYSLILPLLEMCEQKLQPKLHGAVPLSEAQAPKYPPSLMEPEDALPCSQDPVLSQIYPVHILSPISFQDSNQWYFQSNILAWKVRQSLCPVSLDFILSCKYAWVKSILKLSQD